MAAVGEGAFLELSWPGGICPARVDTVGQATIGVRLLPGPPPPAYALVSVRAAEGTWDARCVPAPEDRYLIALPAWAKRTSRRTARRFAVDVDGTWTPGGGHRSLAATLLDVSASGARFLCEADPGVQAGGSGILTAAGRSTACEVRSLSAHEHPLLTFVGVRFTTPADRFALHIRSVPAVRRTGR